MSYYGLGKELNAIVVNIMDHHGAHCSYLFKVAGDPQIRNVVLSLINKIKEEYNIDDKKTYFIGTSKGGTTALLYGLVSGSGNIISGEPQIMLGDFIYQNKFEETEQLRSLAYTITGRVNIGDKELLNKEIIQILHAYWLRFKGSINIIVGETGYYENHIKHIESIIEKCTLSRTKIEHHDFKVHNDVIPVFYKKIEFLKH